MPVTAAAGAVAGRATTEVESAVDVAGVAFSTVAATVAVVVVFLLRGVRRLLTLASFASLPTFVTGLGCTLPEDLVLALVVVVEVTRAFLLLGGLDERGDGADERGDESSAAPALVAASVARSVLDATLLVRT